MKENEKQTESRPINEPKDIETIREYLAKMENELSGLPASPEKSEIENSFNQMSSVPLESQDLKKFIREIYALDKKLKKLASPEPSIEGSLSPIKREKIEETFTRKTGKEITPETFIENYGKIGNLEIAAGSSVGVERNGPDEDSFFVGKTANNEIVLILADGAGGMGGGDIASQIATETIAADLIQSLNHKQNPDDSLKSAYARAQETLKNAYETKIYKDKKLNPEAVLTTTCVSAIISPDGSYTIANLGDSRAYKIGAEGISRLTKDHSAVQDLVDQGKINDEERYTHNLRNYITKSLSVRAKTEQETTPDIFSGKLGPGETIMLSCDGIWEEIRDPQILEIIRRAKIPYEAVANLIHGANENGGRDNATVVLAEQKEISTLAAPTLEKEQENLVKEIASETEKRIDEFYLKESLEKEIESQLQLGQSIKADEFLKKLRGAGKEKLAETLKNISPEEWKIGNQIFYKKDLVSGKKTYERDLITRWQGIEAYLPHIIETEKDKKIKILPESWIPEFVEIDKIKLYEDKKTKKRKIIFYLREKALSPTQEKITVLKNRIAKDQAELDEINEKIAALQDEIEKLKEG